MPQPPARPTPELLRDAAERAIRYLEGIQTRHVGPRPEAIAGLARFQEPLPELPSDPAEVLRMLDEIGSPATMGMAGPRFFGFVIGGALPVTVATNWLASAWDQNTGLWMATPTTSALEEVTLRWLVELFGLPAGTGGGFVTGVSLD
jgi:glutamate/tyrosine decarboxylase-like PLP-dependent enzyme